MMNYIVSRVLHDELYWKRLLVTGENCGLVAIMVYAFPVDCATGVDFEHVTFELL